ncbi:hypothetical protein AB0C34_10110 [Nocardia sp. NPDC049220]|uniref:hypothetical protein n=1 Tax=Nocardia sp. NPDC049220 TaxID=3155273 RepID=UPI0033F4E24C
MSEVGVDVTPAAAGFVHDDTVLLSASFQRGARPSRYVVDQERAELPGGERRERVGVVTPGAVNPCARICSTAESAMARCGLEFSDPPGMIRACRRLSCSTTLSAFDSSFS